ncbi:MAG: hypothetical protein WC586_05965 [Methanoregula sp.]
MARPVNCNPALITLILFLFIFPAAADIPGPAASSSGNPPGDTSPDYAVFVFIPTAKMIHSDQIKDQINGLNGYDVLMATSFGLSTYNGSWETRHMNLDNVSKGLLEDYVTAIEYDVKGNLWLGYGGGIQIYNGRYFETIRDQQLLKNLRINDLQRWNDDMWVATGNAGIHRYRDGTWTWFQPMTPSGPGFYEIDSMVVDPAANAMIIATEDQGLWIIRSPEEPIRFEQLVGKFTPNGLMEHVRRDPVGGAYFFNKNTVVHYRQDTGFVPVLTVKDLSPVGIEINDISAGPDGKLYIATDDGLFIWENQAVFRHLTRFEGMGSSKIVRTVNTDAQNRVWFSTQGYVGYYVDLSQPDNIIGIDLITPAPSRPVVQTTPPAEKTPAPDSAGSPKAVTVSKKSSLFDPVISIINTITGFFGIKAIA